VWSGVQADEVHMPPFLPAIFLSLHYVLQKFSSCVIKERMSIDCHMKKMMLLSRQGSPDVMCIDFRMKKMLLSRQALQV
jgi:hypothetical protein